METEIKRLILQKAESLVNLLEYCDDGDFIDQVLFAVQDCDTLTLGNMLEEAEDENA